MAQRTLKNTHSFIVTLRFNRKCSRKIALREARDNICGQHYCTVYDGREPDEFRIRSVRHKATVRK
jgi:hypothetical protein